MGFFSRDTPSEAPKVVAPVVVQPADLPGFSARLEAVECAVGTGDAQVRSAIRALSESVGGVDLWEVAKRGLPPEELKRPWRWSARACELANEHGDYSLAPRVFNFMAWWRRREDGMTINDYADMCMDSAPLDSVRVISQAAAEAIKHLPDDQDVIPAAREVITVGQIREFVQPAAVE